MNGKHEQLEINKVKTGIPGFDLISRGGMPESRSTLVAGTSGSGKTMFAVQFLAEGIARYDQGGVFVTFEESPRDIRKNFLSFGWDVFILEITMNAFFLSWTSTPNIMIWISLNFFAITAPVTYRCIIFFSYNKFSFFVCFINSFMIKEFFIKITTSCQNF